MTDEDYTTQKARIQALIEEWSTNLGLKWWKVTYNYFDDSGYFRDSERGRDGSISPGCVAYTTVAWPYLEASIYWNLPALVDFSDEEVELIFVHECVHILLKEMQDFRSCDCPHDMNHEERVCTMLTKAFLWTKAYYKEKTQTTNKELTETLKGGRTRRRGKAV